MRHKKIGRRLGRDSSHRKAMFRNMAISLIQHESISTTLPKAKELRRKAFNTIRNKEAVGKLFNEIGPRFKDRPGGYLRILKKGNRPGDSAPMALIQLTDYKIEKDENLYDE